MAVIETWYNQDVQSPVQVQYLNGNVFSQDNFGNLIGVHVFDDGEPAVLSGTVSGNIIRADGGTVAVTGTLSGNDCYIILPEAAYAIPGPISVIVKLTGGGSTTTLCAIVANVYQTSTDTPIDPGTIMPSIQSLLTEIENAVASIPAAGFANGSALNTNIFNVGDYENGAIDQTTGQNSSSSARIRSKLYMPTTAMKYYSSDSDIRFMLYAYDKLGQYVGALQSNGSFGTNAGSFAELDMSGFYTNPNYSGYKYRVVIRSTGGDIQIDNVSGIYIDSYILAVPKNTADIIKNAENVGKLFDIDAGENISRLYDINSPVLWEMGAISYATGENTASTTRGRSKYFIPTNADRISFGTYKTIRGFFLYAYNSDGTYIGAYKKSTGTFVTDGSETGFNTENTYFDIGYFIRQYPTYRFRIAVYARNSGADVSAAEFGSWIITNGLNDSGAKVKVIQYNIGKFNYGVAGGLSTNIAEKIANYRAFLARENVDFLFLQEYVQYIDSGEQYAADDTLFTPLFFEKSYSKHG